MNDKKVGVITFHNSRNYGAVLQAYALQKKLLSIFKEVEVINYQNENIAQNIKLWDCKGNNLKAYTKALVGMLFRLKKKIAFNHYLKKHIKLSKKITKDNINEKAKKYDLLISGSDQIWNTTITKNDLMYFLNFANKKQCRAAYAASFGDEKINLNEEAKKELQKFNIISLRENLMVNGIEEITTHKPFICCDPCFLLSNNDWKNHASNRLIKKPYVFLFMIHESDKIKKYAEKIVNNNNLLLISNKNDFNFFKHIAPNDFLSWIFNAEYIVTDSFHATVFSLIFHKQFISQCFDSKKNQVKKRISELLKTLKLENRVIENEKLDVNEIIDWKQVDDKINNLSNNSWNSFIESLEKYYGGENGK